MANPELPPLVVCTKCGEARPHTREFFSPYPNRSLRNKCKQCCAAETREWRRLNPEKVAAMKQRSKEYHRWTPDAEAIYPLRRCSKCKEAKPNNPDHFSRGGKRDGLSPRCKSCDAADHAADRPNRNARTRAAYARLKRDNPDKIKEWRDDWRTKNRDRYNALMRAGKARRRSRIAETGGSFSADDVARLLKAQRRRCWWCNVKLKDYHVDHRIPIAKGGTSDVANLVISCPDCNFRKHDKMPWEFASRLL